MKRRRSILDRVTPAQLVASPRLARQWAREAAAEAKRLGWCRKKRK